MKHFEIQHKVTFEETNLVGNVYYVNHIRWQGRCRELFLEAHAPSVLTMVEKGALALVTLSCSCEYFEEVRPFETVTIRMTLDKIQQNRIGMNFEYYKNTLLIARGHQRIGCMRSENNVYIAAPIPPDLMFALSAFSYGAVN